jgi:hypothetical protein
MSSNGTTEVVWIHSFLEDFGVIKLAQPPCLGRTIRDKHLLANLVLPSRAKHIVID